MRLAFSALFGQLVRFAAPIGAGSLVLAGCAVDPGAADEASDATSTSSQAVINNGGGPGQGFTCDGATCTCSKTIEGDCDRMRKNCTGDLTNFDNCLKGWLTTDCSCTEGRVVSRPPSRYPTSRTTGLKLSQ